MGRLSGLLLYPPDGVRYLSPELRID